MGLRLNQLQATVSAVFDDIFHLRTSGGFDKKITLPNLIQQIVKYTEINTATTATEDAGTVNKIQVFRNIHTAIVILTLGTSGKTIDMIPNEVSFVVYNGTTWYQLNDVIEGSAANDKQINFAADASLRWDESANIFVLNKGLNISSGVITGSAIIAQAQLKTSMSAVSLSGSATPARYTLPGGQYGFYPQTKSVPASVSTGVQVFIHSLGASIGTSYVTGITLNSITGVVIYAQQRYVTSSGEVFWVFLLMEKIFDTDGITQIGTKQIGSCQAPDHVCFGNGGDPEKVPHPFGSFDSALHEIIVINPLQEDVLKMREECKSLGKDLLQYINEDFNYEDIKTPMYPEADGKAGYIPLPITVGLVNDEDWNLEGKIVEIEKKIIIRPDYIKVKKLVKKV